MTAPTVTVTPAQYTVATTPGAVTVKTAPATVAVVSAAPQGPPGPPGASGTTDHAALSHLDYASAGHQGFTPAGRQVLPGAGLSGGGDLSADRTLSLADTAVVPGSYVNAGITVDQQGRITAAASGAGGGVTSFNTRTGAVTLASADVTAALGFSDLARTGMANTFTPDQTFSGNVLLPATTATAGQIKVGPNNLLNAFGTNNVFLGAMAGNLTLTGASNLCIGQGAGNALTSGADDVLIGTSAGTNMTAGYQSVCIGSGAGNSLHASGNNVLIGYHAGFSLNNDNNTMVGVNAGYSVTGTLNTVVGQSAGLNATSAGSCVLVGYSAGGATLRTGGNNVLLGASADTAAAGTAYGVALGDSAVCASNECAFGPHVNVQTGYGTSSVQVRPRADFTDSAVDNTDATRKYRRVWNAWDTAAREVMRGEADGAGPRVGFLGAAAVSRRTVNAACTDLATAVALTNQLRQLLIDLGYAQ